MHIEDGDQVIVKRDVDVTKECIVKVDHKDRVDIINKFFDKRVFEIIEKSKCDEFVNTMNTTYNGDLQSMIYRICGDYSVRTALNDTFLTFPVYCCDHLKLQLNEYKFKTNIDPNLFIMYMGRNVLVDKMRNKYGSTLFNKYKDDNFDYDHVLMRGKYQWIATVFSQDQYNRISIVSPIHNLQPRKKYKNQYLNIEHIFQLFLLK